MNVNIGRAGLLLFGGVILYIAGVYLGSFFLYFYYVFLFYVLFSFFQAVVTLLRIRAHQEFSTSHPVKGEELDYYFNLTNESILPSSLLRVWFLELHPGAPPLLPPVERVLKSNGRISMQTRISCPYRGVYRVGAKYLEVVDLLGILRLRRRLEGRTFYVLPRIIPISAPFFSSHRIALSADSSSWGVAEDYSLYRGMKPYREPESVRHMDWKRFLSTGLPVLKEYGTTSQPGVTVYLDLRPVPAGRGVAYAVEDCVMEVLVSLAHYFISMRIPLFVRTAGKHPREHRLTSEAEFRVFHNATASLAFDGSISPVELFTSDNAELMDAERTVLFITHREDGGIFELLEHFTAYRHGIAAAVITRGLGERLRRGVELYLQGLAEQGCEVRALRRPEELNLRPQSKLRPLAETGDRE